MAERTETFEKPRKPRPPAATAPGAAIAPVSVVASRLLIVEDEPATRFALGEFFQSLGYAVDAVSDLPSARKRLDESRYDVVITDLDLTASNSNEGMEVISHARQRHAQACIIMLTAFGSTASETEARRRGVDLFTAKPVGLRELSTYIDKVQHSDRVSSELSVRER